MRKKGDFTIKKTCKDCKHFYQHYGLIDGKLYCIRCGHCGKGRVKHRRPDGAACDAFEAGKTEWELAAPKDGMMKTVLDYLLEMMPRDKEAPCP